MEEEKKKKRNKKKKKQQQNKRVDDAIVGGPISSADENHIGDIEIAESSGRLDVDDLQSSHHINGVQIASELDGKGYGILHHLSSYRVTISEQFEETIKKLRDENDSYLHREVLCKETIQRLETANEAHTQKEAFLEERLVHLNNENEAHIQNKEQLEETIKKLSDENDSYRHREVLFKEIIQRLEAENEAHIHKEEFLEERLVHSNNENEAHIQNKKKLEEKLVNLEKENDELVHEMSSIKVKMAKLLEERSVVTNKEDGFEEELNSQIAESCTLEKILIHDEMKQRDDFYNDIETSLVDKNSLEGESEKHESVSLNSNGEVDMESQDVIVKEDEISVVPLVEAPLIGAPFRFVSFVARYVSGADLVEKTTRQ